MAKEPLLKQEETMDLIKRAQANDTVARDKLMDANKRLVSSIAYKEKINTTSLDFEDLTQEGSIGLMKAIDRFDIERGFKFSTYATWWIRQAIKRAISDSGKTIRIPVHIQESLQRINKIKKILEQELNRDPSIEEIYEKLKIDISWYDKIVDHSNFKDLTDALKKTEDINSVEVSDVEAVIMEDLDFSEEAEIICKKIMEIYLKKFEVPDKDTVSNKVILSVSGIRKIMAYENNMTSLDRKVSDEVDNTIGDIIASDENVEDTLDRKYLELGIRQAIQEVYGEETKRVLDSISKYENQIKYLSEKKDKEILDIQKEIEKISKNSELEEVEKKYLFELLAVISKKNKNANIQINKTKEIEKILELKRKAESKAKIPKDELIMRRFGICGYKKETLEEVGAMYEISRERVRQIEKRIVNGSRFENKELKEKLIKYCNLDIEKAK